MWPDARVDGVDDQPSIAERLVLYVLFLDPVNRHMHECINVEVKQILANILVVMETIFVR